MVDVDENMTGDFNRIIVDMLENILVNSHHSIISFDFDTVLEEFTISNLMNASMEEENEKVLTKDDSIELEFTGDIYKKKEGIEDSCCICLNNIENCEFIYKCDKCNHVNHYDCMNEWVKRKMECPACRTDITHKTVVKDKFTKFIEDKLDI
tara:strand:- start:511 stop:966 length:456 start_codon:yes stop_codon:yes gene_type:complete